jgi:hypothetical protein
MNRDQVIEQISVAFAQNPYPGDPFLQGSWDGGEPYQEVSAFFGRTDWTALDSKMLDTHYNALSFFSEAGFRFFLPAYLIADLRDELLTADPLFHLWHGLAAQVTQMQVGSQTFIRSSGGENLLNPRRYGAIAWRDYARHRLAVFTREEAGAIVSYMTFKRDHDPCHSCKEQIDTALNEFWRERSASAPSQANLNARLQEEADFAAHLVKAQSEKRAKPEP